MPFFQLPRPGQAVHWLAEQPRTIVRFSADGGLAVLHATTDPRLTVAQWLSEPLLIGLHESARQPEPPTEVPPVLCARLGTRAAVAAPVCLLELGEPAAIYAWLNTRPAVPQLRLVLLRLSERAGQARVETSRRVWGSEWAAGDGILRLQLEQQYLNTSEDEAGEVQAAGRALVSRQPADQLLSSSAFTLVVDQPLLAS